LPKESKCKERKKEKTHCVNETSVLDTISTSFIMENLYMKNKNSFYP